MENFEIDEIDCDQQEKKVRNYKIYKFDKKADKMPKIDNEDKIMLDFIDNNDTIYTDFSFLNAETEEAFIEPSTPKPLNWGSHSVKPPDQQHWEDTLSAVISSIAGKLEFEHSLPPKFLHLAGTSWSSLRGMDIRPRVQDKISNEWILIDSGAMVSVYPRKRYPTAKLDMNTSIQAINKSKIQTYGTTLITIRMGRKTYNHTVILADVDQPVLGWDFC